MKTISRRVNRVVRLLLIFLLTFYTSAGCFRQEAKYEEGTFRRFSSFRTSMMLALQSDKDTFPIDDVTVDLLYGLYDIDIVEDEYNGNPRGEYSSVEGHMVFTLHAWNFGDPRTLSDVNDYREVENYYLIKAIPEEEAFFEDYGYELGWLWYITYHHKETVKIPQEAFTQDRGQMFIYLILWGEREMGSGEHPYRLDTFIRFSYEKVDNNMIKLYFY